MAEVKWIKITTDIFDDEKILLIESMPDAYAIITVWFKLLCLAGKQNNSGVFVMNNQIAYTDKMLAVIFRMKESTVAMALQTFEQFGMVEIIDGVITIPNWGKHQSLEQLQARKEYQREYHREYRKKQKLLLNAKNDGETLRKHLRNDDVNTQDIDKERELEKENNIICTKSQPSKAEANDLFEHLWSLYPNKKGKGAVSDSKKKTLFAVGKEEMERAIERYKKELAKDASWRKPQNGSTFFNSGYIDYLDKNWGATAEPAAYSSGMDDLDGLF